MESEQTLELEHDEQPDSEDREQALRDKARKAGFWVASGYGLGQVLRLGSNLIMTRLLFEEAFGLMAIVYTVTAGIDLFSDIGARPAVIHDKGGDDPSFLNTAWTMQAGRGIFLWLVACALAVPAAEFYSEPVLMYLLPVTAFGSVIEGFHTTKVFTEERRLSQGRLVFIELASQVVALIAVITWALISPSVWALVVGGLISPTVNLILGFAILPGHKNKFEWDKKAAVTLFRFGRWVFLTTALMFASHETDRLIFGKLVGMAELGVYSIGVYITQMPAALAGYLQSSVTFPMLSRQRELRGSLVSVFEQSRDILFVVVGYVLSGFIAGGPTGIDLLYDERYAGAGFVVQVLAVAAWLEVIESSYDTGLFAMGTPKWMAIGNLVKLLSMFLFIPLGFHLAGFHGAIVGFAATQLPLYTILAIIGNRSELRGFAQDVRLSLLIAFAALLGYVAVLPAEHYGLHVLIRAFIVFAVVTLVWSPLLIPALKKFKQRRKLDSEP